MNNYNRDNLTGKNHEGKLPNTPLKYLTASTIIGEKVINSSGERLGEVKDIMLDLTEGRIQYVVIEYGGFLGIGEKFFAVPFEILGINTDEHALVLNYEKEVLESAPGFDKEHWPETNSHSYEKYGAYWGDFMGSNTGSVPY